MNFEALTHVLQTFGFPVFVAVWLLLRSDKKEERTTQALYDLKRSIDALCTRAEFRRGNAEDNSGSNVTRYPGR